MNVLFRRIGLSLLSIAGASSASGQDFNVKCGLSPVPAPSYGAATGQAGFWNLLRMNIGDLQLVDAASRSTGAFAVAEFCDEARCEWCDGPPCPGFSGDADATALLGSWFNGDCFGSGHYFGVRSLAPGRYEMHLYLYHGCNPALVANVDFKVLTAFGGVTHSDFFQLGGAAYQGTWSGFPVGVQTFDIAPGSRIEVRWGSHFGGVTGFQLTRLDETGVAFCASNAPVGNCPCFNNGGSGRGCENSSSSGGAVLYASGEASLSLDTLSFTSAWERPSAFSIILQGDALIPAVAFGDGLRCTGGNLKRLYSKHASFGSVSAPDASEPSVSARSAQTGDSIAPGETRYYQTYYRDPSEMFCPAPTGGTFNSSSGVVIVWGG